MSGSHRATQHDAGRGRARASSRHPHPGALPVIVVGGSGPITTGRRPRYRAAAPAQVTPAIAAAPQSSTQAAEAAAAPAVPGGASFLGCFCSSVWDGGAFTAQHLGLMLPIALPAAVSGLIHPPPPPPPPVKLVRWTLSSEPASAEVLDKASRSLLGTTPWFREQPSAAGKQALIVRAAGYRDAELELDQSQDASPHIRLAERGDLWALASSPMPARAQRHQPAAAAVVDPGTSARPVTPPPSNSVKADRPRGDTSLRPPQPNGPRKKPPTAGGLRDEDLPTSLLAGPDLPHLADVLAHQLGGGLAGKRAANSGMLATTPLMR